MNALIRAVHFSRRLILWVTPGLLLAPSPGWSQSVEDTPRKEIRAVHVNPRSPRVDGRLDDEAWQAAEFISDFLMKEPNEGAEPTDRTEVAVVYDSDALYIGARCYVADGSRLRLYLDRRDRQGPTEQFIVTIDSYLDRRTGYGFGVNTAGVRFDRYNPEDTENNRDYTYDPVWKARTHVDTSYWSAEMRIPFSQLRFNAKPEQVWGINFNRWIPGRNEDVYWVYVPRNETGWASRFGNLVGIQNIRPSRRIEILPYVASNGVTPTGRNPLSGDTEHESRAGGDLKMGLGPNMTLDATFNPDFGQVEADPAVVNLSAFETFFGERRPFFLEGSQLLAGDGPSYYYSRRIGAYSRILGASKITGRLQSGTSIGILAAVTERDHDITEPMTAFGVGRLEQQFGPNQSTVGVSLTGARKDLENRIDFLENLHSSAVSGGTDWKLRFLNGTYEIRGYAGYSRVDGSRAAILQTQTSSARYYQRPDADYVQLDSNRTGVSGYTGALTIHKRAGRHWLWQLEGSTKSPGFELNDVGQLSTADDIDFFGQVVYRETEPGDLFRSYWFEVLTFGNWNYGGIRQHSQVGMYTEAQWRNFWNTWIWYDYLPVGQSDNRTRGGPTMKREAGHSLGGGFNSNYAKSTQFGASFTASVDDLDGWVYNIGGRFTKRLGNRLQVSLDPRYRREDQPRQFVTTIDTAFGGDQTYGSRYVFSRIAQTTLSCQFRLNYFLTPNLSIEGYAEPFVAGGHYYQHGELARAGDNELRVYEESGDAIIQPSTDDEGNPVWVVDDARTGTTFSFPDGDFNFLSFRSNMVLRWEFRPGSTLFLVWQRNLGEGRDPNSPVELGSLWDTLAADGFDFFAFKIAYWIPLP